MRVRVMNPAKTATQSGRSKQDLWIIEPVLPTPRTPDPMTGWTAAQDTLSTLSGQLRFHRVEDALSFAHRQGWTVDIEPPSTRRVVPKSYMDHFNPRALLAE